MLFEAIIGLSRGGRVREEHQYSAIRVEEYALDLLACLPTLAVTLWLETLELLQTLGNDASEYHALLGVNISGKFVAFFCYTITAADIERS